MSLPTALPVEKIEMTRRYVPACQAIPKLINRASHAMQNALHAQSQLSIAPNALQTELVFLIVFALMAFLTMESMRAACHAVHAVLDARTLLIIVWNVQVVG
jgi:hypothetical protein